MRLAEELNELLVETFNVILKGEEKSLKKLGNHNLSINEFHLLEAIAKNDYTDNTISALAAAVNLTKPSVTIAVKKLEKKGYLKKTKSEQDGRVVYSTLTESGAKVNAHHQKFHSFMVSQVVGQLSDEETELLYNTILKLNKFFKKAMG